MCLKTFKFVLFFQVFYVLLGKKDTKANKKCELDKVKWSFTHFTSGTMGKRERLCFRPIIQRRFTCKRDTVCANVFLACVCVFLCFFYFIFLTKVSSCKICNINFYLHVLQLIMFQLAGTESCEVSRTTRKFWYTYIVKH